MRQLRERGGIATRRVSRAAAAVFVLAACGSTALVPPPLDAESRRIAAVAAPAGWVAYLPAELDDDQFVAEVDGVPLLYFSGGAAGADRGQGQAVSVGVAWQSEVVTSTNRDALCDQAADYGESAGYPTVLDADECRRTLDRDDLRPGFVVPFGTSVETLTDPAGDSRAVTGGVVQSADGTLRLVVSLSYSLAP
jgi:hypothetical protein